MPIITDIARTKVRARFASDQIDQVLIQRGGPGTTDPDTLVTTGMSNPVTVYEGRARVTRVTPSGTVEVGEGEISQRTVDIQVPFDVTAVHVDDTVTIVSAEDEALAGSAWRVTGVDGGGSWNVLTTLTCSGWYPSSYWSGS